MAKRIRTERQLLLQEAQAELKAQRQRLKQQRLRVAAARRAVDLLSGCDWCGIKTLPTGTDPQLCPDCAAARYQQQRVALLAQHGYGPDGRRQAAA
jgi:hypothetical protein